MQEPRTMAKALILPYLRWRQ